MVQVQKQFQDRGVNFIGLTVETVENEESLPQIQGFLNTAGITWPNGYGANDTLVAFESDYIPRAWVIGPNGEVVWNFDEPGSLEDGIEKALAMVAAE